MSDTVLVVGASGWLGGQIAEALIARDEPVRLAFRGGATHAKATPYLGRAEIVAADLVDAASLEDAMRGVHTIVSAVSGDRGQVVDGQIALARAGLAAGVSRILPSDFAIDFRGVSTERHLWLGWREEADREIERLGLGQANILNGAFIEVLALPFFEMLDVAGSRIRFWGDADRPYDFTATKDVAAFTAEVVGDRERLGPQMVVTERVTMREFAGIASTAFGRPFTLDRAGDLAALDAEIERRQAVEPQNPYVWSALQYQRMMASGEGTLRLPVSSSTFGEPTRIIDFLGHLAAGAKA